MSYVLGTDTSHWSGNIDFAKMYSELKKHSDTPFWFTKATDSARGSGQLFEDVKLDAYCNQVFALNQLLAGCFHWLQPDTDPVKAARFYLARYFRYKFHLPPILDFEEAYAFRDENGNPTHLESHYSWCGQMWVDEVRRNVETVWIYSAKWYTDNFQKHLLGWLNEYFLITAQYPGIVGVPTSGEKPLFPYPWSEKSPDQFNWAWQYSADDNNRGEEFGVTADHIDLDWYPKSSASLLALPGVKPLPDNDQELMPTGTYEIVLSGNMAICKDPATSQAPGNIVYGYGLPGDRFIATEKTETGFYKILFNGVDAWISGNTRWTIITEIMKPVPDPEPEPVPEPEQKPTLASIIQKIKNALPWRKILTK